MRGESWFSLKWTLIYSLLGFSTEVSDETAFRTKKTSMPGRFERHAMENCSLLEPLMEPPGVFQWFNLIKEKRCDDGAQADKGTVARVEQSFVKSGVIWEPGTILGAE